MPIQRKRIISALTIHFATTDIRSEDGSVQIPAGTFKNAQVEYAEYLEEDGVQIDGTHKRVTASIRDINALPDIGNAALNSVAKLTLERNDAMQRLEASEMARAALERDHPTTRMQ